MKGYPMTVRGLLVILFLFATTTLSSLPSYGYAIDRHNLSALWTLPPEIEQVLELPEEAIDVGRVALTFEKLTRPGLDVEAYLRRIDELAAKVRAVNLAMGARSWMWSIENVLKSEGYQYDFSPNWRASYNNHSLSGLLDTKLGFCDSMTALYIAVAQRVGLKPYPVKAPEHIFVRYTELKWEGGNTMNVEPSSGGWITDAAMIERSGITAAGLKSGAYMRTLTYREYLAYFLMKTGRDMLLIDDSAMFIRSKAYLDRAAQRSPADAEIALNLAMAYGGYANMAEELINHETARAWREASGKWHAKALELGYIKGRVFAGSND